MPSDPKYLTVDEMLHRLGPDEADQLAGTGLRDAREIDAVLIADALRHADTLIDGYVRARYPAPFAVVPDLLKGIAHDIARYRLRSMGGQQSAMNDAVQKQYDAAMALLKDIGGGRVTLDANGDGTQPEAGTHADAMRGEMPAGRACTMLEGWR
ncbi:DUF1320 domain-containing protein [Xanthobacter sp. VTT E-85241]|uniref:gp436 family protein n=1 Tax=Roseixanthobacter finlandensis TaxID=3119922 RepID=UPI003728BCEB